MNKALIDRINQRLGALGKTARSASLEATGNPDTIRRLSHGRAEWPRADTLLGLAEALETTPHWLLGRTESPDAQDSAETPAAPPRDLPVRGTARGAHLRGAFQLRPAIVDRVWRPPALAHAGDAYAFFVEGDSMEPEFRRGELYFAHPGRPAVPGDAVIVRTRIGEDRPVEATIGRLVVHDDEQLQLFKHNPRGTVDMELATVAGVDRVLTNREIFGL